jgi:hypothetical protein
LASIITFLLLLSSFKDHLLGLHLIKVVVPAAVSLVEKLRDMRYAKTYAAIASDSGRISAVMNLDMVSRVHEKGTAYTLQ